MARIVEHLPVAELEARYRAAPGSTRSSGSPRRSRPGWCRRRWPSRASIVAGAWPVGECWPAMTGRFTDEAIAAWRAEPRTTRGGQPHYSALAITTGLTLRAVFGLALRQTEGLIGSILRLLGLDLAVPDHSTLSRRAETLEVPRPRSGSARAPAGRQHGAEAVWCWRVAGREARQRDAPLLAQTPHRQRCRDRPDRRGGVDHERRR
jgi:DDE family transposase